MRHRPLLALLGLAACATSGGELPSCPPGEPLRIKTAGGPEDVALVPLPGEAARLFIRVGGEESGIDAVTLAPDGTPAPASKIERVATFRRSLGLSYLPGDAQRPDQLFAIDQEEHKIRRFKVKGEALEEGNAIPGGDLLPRANDLLALARPDAEPDIYVSNPDFFFERLFVDEWPSVALLRDGQQPRAVVNNLATANGIVADPSGNHVLVADYRSRRLQAYRRNPANGGLEPLCHVPIGGMPDNLSIDLTYGTGDRVLVAAQDSFWRAALHLLVSKRVDVPSRVYVVSFADLQLDALTPGDDPPCKPEYKPELLWTDGGEHVAAGSVAVRHGERLLIGQILRPDILAFRCPPAAS
jgi:hypothetical protein